jgi:hypothetical protein
MIRLTIYFLDREEGGSNPTQGSAKWKRRKGCLDFSTFEEYLGSIRRMGFRDIDREKEGSNLPFAIEN